jgi:nitrite reductase/ring-hydroxylating ferredoxin subunit
MPVEFIKVARTTDIPDRRSKRVHLEGEEIALWNVGGIFHAISNICSHQHIAALHQGSLNGLMLTCPMHGWTYSLETGLAASGSGRVKVYRVKVEGRDLFVEKPGSPE